MSNVSSWDPADENNTAPPPDGWPEFMMPSQVNNAGRMMMGAVRRMYDEMVAGSLVLPYLPLTGGSLSGSLSVTGNVTASGTVQGNFLYSTGHIQGGGSFSVPGTVTAGTVSSGNITGSGTIQGLDVTATRNMSVAGTLYGGAISGSNISATGTVSGTNVTASSTVSGANITASGTLTGVTINGTNINASGNIAASGALSCNGGLACTGGIMAWNGKIRANTGNVEAALDVIAGQHISVAGTLYGNVYAGNSMNLGGEVRGGALATAGQAAVGGNIDVGGTAYVASILPNSDFTGICGGASQGWHDVVSYNYVTKSDAALKEDLGPLPDTLALVSAIEPQAFRYSGDQVRHWGFVAQDVRAAIGSHPVDLVSGEEGQLGLDYGGLTATLWKAVQELTERLTALEAGGV